MHPHPPAPPPQIIIHPMVQPKAADAMCEEAYAAIASSLPPQLVAPRDEDGAAAE